MSLLTRLAAGVRAHAALTALAALGVLILCALGTWQLQRLDWKRGLIAAVEARVERDPAPFAEVLERWRAGEDVEYTPVRLAGRFLHEHEAHVFGTLDGKAGYYVFTPLKVVAGGCSSPSPPPLAGEVAAKRSEGAGDREGLGEAARTAPAPSVGSADTSPASGGGAARGGCVYVNRGFVPLENKTPATRADGLVEGPVAVEGLFRGPQAPSGVAAWVAPADSPEANEWHARDPARFAAVSGLAAAPAMVDSFGREAPGVLPQGGTTKIEFRNNHLQYAFTWFGLAATLVGVWGAFVLRDRDANAFSK
ncbi:MAG: SURF1 family protein [Pseudomonadota bacterium]